MAEKIKSNKKDKEIKEDLVDINIKSFNCDDSNNDESKLITKYFDYERIGFNIFKGKTIPFFYNEILDNGTDTKINKYFTSIKQELRYAYGTMETLQQLEDYIDVLDRPENEDRKKLLPRYKKMKRLESFYEILIRFTMTMIHNFFWLDIQKGINGVGVKPLSYRIKQIIPIMLRLKKDIENELDREYPRDKFEIELQKN